MKGLNVGQVLQFQLFNDLFVFTSLICDHSQSPDVVLGFAMISGVIRILTEENNEVSGNDTSEWVRVHYIKAGTSARRGNHNNRGW